MRKRLIFTQLIMLLLLFCVVGCSKKNVKKEHEMPEIVFMEETQAPEGGVSICFLAKDGYFYRCNDIDVICMPFEDKLDLFRMGDARFVKTNNSRNVSDVQFYYEQLYDIVADNYCQLMSPDVVPCVETNTVLFDAWYLDDNGQWQLLRLHEYYSSTHVYTNDERANDIYGWFAGTKR